MDIDEMTPGEILADANVADFIGQLGLAIADAQRALDENSVNQIAEFVAPRESLGDRSLLDLGLSPAFYHYQHADLSVALQINLRVEKDLSVGVNLSGSFNDNQTSQGNSSESSNSTTSGSTVRTRSRRAEVEIQSASVGQLNIGGRNFTLTGDDPLARIRNLQREVIGDSSSGVQRLLYRITPQTFNITTDAPSDKVKVGTNTVAFIGGGFDRGLIQIDDNSNTTYNLNGTTNSVDATAQADLAAYANHVKTLVEGENYDTVLLAPTHSIQRFHFKTGEHHLETFTLNSTTHNENYDTRLQYLALMLKHLGQNIIVKGWADAQQFRRPTEEQRDQANLDLSENRAIAVRDKLVAYGLPASQISIQFDGDHEAERNVANNGGPVDNIDFRKVEILTNGRSAYWLVVKSKSGGPNLDSVSPDKLTPPPSAGNGFIYLYKPTPMNLSGKKVTINGTDFPLSGAPGGGHASGAPTAYAFNLSRDINANAGVDYTSSAERNVVTVFNKTQPFQVSLLTTETRNINLQSSEGVEIRSQFSRTETRNESQQNTGNRTVAIGASVDVRFAKQFESNVTGNSSISARLVSIPAPPQFLEVIKEYLNDDGED